MSLMLNCTKFIVTRFEIRGAYDKDDISIKYLLIYCVDITGLNFEAYNE